MNASLLLTALFNGAWQGAALCVLALLAFRIFRRLNATTMFAVWSVLLGIAVLLPVANYAFATKPYVVVQRVRDAGASIPQRDTRTSVLQRDTRASTKPRPEVSKGQRDTRASINLVAVASNVLRYAPMVLALLALVALVRLGILVHDVVRMLLARKRVRLIEAPVHVSEAIARPFRYAASSDFTSPCVLGFAPALIVIPEDLLSDDDAELTSVVLHECEHVRRFDDVQNVLHRVIGAIAFFCPGVRIALRELALYREQICDDAAISATGDRVSYAMTLTDLAHWAQGRGAPVPSLIFKRKHLLHRLEVLLDSAVSHSLRMNRRFAFAAGGALILAAALVLRIQVPVIAQTIVQASPAPVTQNVRVRMRNVHARVEQMHTQVKAMREQVKQLRVQANEMREQMVKIHSEMNKARTTVKPMHVHLHAYHSRPYDVATVMPKTASVASPASTATTITTVPTVTTMSVNSSGDLLDALNAAGLRNLSVDDLIAIRDHGVTPDLVRDATSYFGHVSAKDLVYLADHGVGSNYLGTLRASGVRGISPADAVKLMDHGVSAPLINAAAAYFGRATADDLTALADHGVSSSSLQGFRAVGLTGISVHDVVRLFDNGVDAAYVAKVRRLNPHASIDDIIRLRDAGF
ncbi:MAG TPA: M56 family metallopeptidase [Candidatus Baltobacteraceae bacterium]|nr:M56 family metallopeptidase [Candidatus Baltobacteraceae bacterium]